MTDPDQNDPTPSEKTNPDAASPSAETRPDSPISQKPQEIRVFDAPLVAAPGPKSIRPPTSTLPSLMPKPSSAPPPRLRPAAPESSNNIGPGALSQPLLSDAEISATQEIAEALSSAPWNQAAHAAGNNLKPAPSAAGAPTARARHQASGSDPLIVRRTIIPILLTGGAILAGAGALLMFGGEDNALSDLFPSWVPMMFCVLAAICLGFGVLNMLAVKNAKG